MVGKDGKTAQHRVRGRESSRRAVGFGEKVLYMIPTKGPEHDERAKLDSFCKEGLVLGYCRDSPEYHVYSLEDSKMVRARTIRRLPDEYRWDATALE